MRNKREMNENLMSGSDNENNFTNYIRIPTHSLNLYNSHYQSLIIKFICNICPIDILYNRTIIGAIISL